MQDKASHTNVWLTPQHPAVRAAFPVWYFVWLFPNAKSWKAVCNAIFGLTARFLRMAGQRKTYGPRHYQRRGQRRQRGGRFKETGQTKKEFL